jgi:hypothetical protein
MMHVSQEIEQSAIMAVCLDPPGHNQGVARFGISDF